MKTAVVILNVMVLLPRAHQELSSATTNVTMDLHHPRELASKIAVGQEEITSLVMPTTVLEVGASPDLLRLQPLKDLPILFSASKHMPQSSREISPVLLRTSGHPMSMM
jgi:hypothetical protein